jgi:hypothetical protein
MKQPSVNDVHATLQETLDVLEVIKTPGAEQIDDEVRSRKPHAIALECDEVLAVFGSLRDVRGLLRQVFLLGGA